MLNVALIARWTFGFLTGILLLAGCGEPLEDRNVIEEYHPDHKITFPHEIHTEQNGIDCKFCHNSNAKSRTNGLTTEKNCLNCHKQVGGKAFSDSIISQYFN
jgi:hypothetical protein